MIPAFCFTSTVYRVNEIGKALSRKENGRGTGFKKAFSIFSFSTCFGNVAYSKANLVYRT